MTIQEFLQYNRAAIALVLGALLALYISFMIVDGRYVTTKDFNRYAESVQAQLDELKN